VNTRPGGARPEPTAADRRALDEPRRLAVDHLLDQTSQPFFLAGFDGRLLETNRAFQRFIGYSAEELAGMTFLDLTPDAWLEISTTMAERVREGDTPQRFEKAYRHRDGRERPVELLADLVRDDAGQPFGYSVFLTDIGDRKRQEAELRALAVRFQKLYDEAPFGYHEIDAQGVIRLVNRTECELLGYAREEMIGRPIFDFIHPSQREESSRAVSERIRGERQGGTIERTYITKDGRELIVSIENRLIRDNQDRVTGLRSTVQDVTGRKKTEASLVASERRARALFEGIEDAVFVHDLEGHILDANPAACRRLGYTRDELLSLTTRDIDDPTFAAGFGDRLEEQMRQGHLRIEGRHRTKAGRLVPVDINTSMIQLEEQAVVLAVIRDITERKALEETRRQFAEAQLKNSWEIEAKNRQLSQSESRYRQLTEGCLDAIVVTDQAGRIALFNPAAERTFGYRAADVLGREFVALMAEEARDELARGLNDYLQKRGGRLVGRTVELHGRRQDGASFPLEMSLSAIETAGTVQFMGAIRDQAERHRMRAMLMQSEKLASIGLLSAGVAHEINNPLAFIANNLAVLERDLKGVLGMVAVYEEAEAMMPAEARDRVRALADDLDWAYVRDNLGRMITRTREGVQRVASIVQNLRGLARTAPPKLEPALLGDLIDSALEMVHGRLRRHHIAVETDIQTPLKIACVPSQIGQVILNLLVNAIQAVESRGASSENRIRIATRQEAQAQVLEFHDTGPGIPADALPRLFDPFFTTKPVGEGTGLGLAISHGIVTGHGGRIEVESEPGQGACFRVLLPWKPAELGSMETSRHGN
jgi:PAS domain S-box-containing protein